jgi:hypothetical protein
MHFREQRLNTSSVMLNSMKHWNAKGNKHRLQGISKMLWLSRSKSNYKNSRRTTSDVLRNCERRLSVPVYDSRNSVISNCHLDAAHMLSLMYVSVWET